MENLGRGGFTTGGIFCALSDTKPEVTLEAMQAARRYGVVISYYLNYRDSLWKSIGGKKRAQEVNRRLAPLVDVMLGNEEDFSAARGYEVSGVDESHQNLPVESFKKMIAQVVNDFSFKVVATTLRKAETASRYDWGEICYTEGEFYQVTPRASVEILDRVGGGDSFASGRIYGFLAGQDAQWGGRVWSSPRRARDDDAR